MYKGKAAVWRLFSCVFIGLCHHDGKGLKKSWFYEPKKAINIKSDDIIRTKWVGLRAFVVTFAALGIAVNTLGIIESLDKANALKEEEIKIRKEQLDLARRQFMLDSIVAAKNEKNR